MAMKTARSHQTPPLLKLGKEAEHTNKIIQWSNVVALLSVAVWLVLVSIIFYLSGPMTEDNPNYQRLSTRSCSVSNTVASFELGAILLRIIHQSNLDGTKWIKKFGNGGFNNGYVIMGMSAITNLWLANFLTPVTTDNITGMTVYPLRWAQWSVSVRRLFLFLLFMFLNVCSLAKFWVFFLYLGLLAIKQPCLKTTTLRVVTSFRCINHAFLFLVCICTGWCAYIYD